MSNTIIIVLAFFAISWVNKNTFYWKTIVEYLWKEVYKKADMMAKVMEIEDKYSGIYAVKGYEKSIMIMGTLINAILDFVNHFNVEKESEDESEEETFGYGRFNFDLIVSSAKRDPEIFKRVLKK